MKRWLNHEIRITMGLATIASVLAMGGLVSLPASAVAATATPTGTSTSTVTATPASTGTPIRTATNSASLTATITPSSTASVTPTTTRTPVSLRPRTAPAILGTAGSYSVLGATPNVTNTGATTIQGNLGVSPAAAFTNAGSLTFTDPASSVHLGDSNPVPNNAAQAQADASTAFTALSNPACGSTKGPDLTGLTLVPGVYCVPAAATNLAGTLTLDAGGVVNAKWVFQVSSALITSSGSTVSMINVAPTDPNECNVFWQVDSSATLGTNSRFVGNIVALTSVGLFTGANVTGRALALNAAVTMDTNTIANPTCVSVATSLAPVSTNTPTVTATSVPATPTSIPATATSVPSSGGGGGGGGTTVQVSSAPSAPVAGASSAPVVGPSTSESTLSPQVPAPVQPESTVAAVEIPDTSAAEIFTAAETPVPQVPATLPRSGGGYGEIRRELLVAGLLTAGLFAMSLWLRKRRKF
jgi:hypothetical protein